MAQIDYNFKVFFTRIGHTILVANYHPFCEIKIKKKIKKRARLHSERLIDKKERKKKLALISVKIDTLTDVFIQGQELTHLQGHALF